MATRGPRPDHDLSADEVRRMAVAAQGLAAPRPRGRIDRRHLRAVFDRIDVVQIDAVNVLVRSQELPLFARLGPHPRDLLWKALADGELFEYWAHVAAIVRARDHHLYRFRMAAAGDWKWTAALEERRPGYLDEVERRVRDDGPVVAADLGQRVGKKGPWWDWDDGKQALARLFMMGRLVAQRRPSDFAQVYDLPERALSPAVLAVPTPTEADARKALLLKAARAYGVATVADLADYHRQLLTTCRPLVAELVEAGELIPVKVQSWTAPAFRHPDARLPRRVTGRALLSPFDSMVWNRDRNLRLFDFHYRIEIYTPAAKRRYGYYVLPFLLDGRIVARVDLKADRAASTLLVPAVHREGAVADREVAAALAAELGDLAGWLGLRRIEVADRGDLAPALRAAVGTGAMPGASSPIADVSPPGGGPTVTP